MDPIVTQEYLKSTPLLSYQLDVTHLHNVLQGIIAGQQQQQQQQQLIARKVNALESAVANIDTRLQNVESAIGGFGGADELRALRQHLIDVARAVDTLNESVIPNIQRQQEETSRFFSSNNNQLQQMINIVPALERAAGELRRDLDLNQRNISQIVEHVTALEAQAQTERAEADNRERSRGITIQQNNDVVRELAARLERTEREIASRLNPAAMALEDLARRTHENFREVENSAKAVDVELAKLHSDLANLRAELNSVDNDGRHRLGKVTEDVDSKFNVVLNLMQNFERNNQIMEQHITAAGQVLATRDPRQSRSGSLAMDSRPVPTPTTGGGYPSYATTNVRRNFSTELERGGPRDL
jgi:chromosome segregation ATPase